VREEGRHVRGNTQSFSKRERVIGPALEKRLLKLHRAVDVKSFWKAVQRLFSASLTNQCVGLLLQQNPNTPVIANWTRSMREDFLATELFDRCAMQSRRRKLARLNDLFHNRSSFLRSGFYRRYMAPHQCEYGVALFFWKQRKPICAMTILRSGRQGDLSPDEMELLRQLYPHLLAALRRIETLERERSIRADLEEFFRRLPLPTIILRWNLKPVYQNNAAREFCAVWEKGPEEARRTKANSSLPPEILDRCRGLKQRWIAFSERDAIGACRSNFKEQQVQHPRLAYLRATIQLKQIHSFGVARPRFLVACEDLCRNGEQQGRFGLFRLPGIARLTRREREVAQLACRGCSNKEIAQDACLSLPTVKKHLHSIFRKLQVPSRTRLVALAA
jgi:DNA-binding CsgD family transcriptional regulator